MDHTSIINELGTILRGESAAWEGDRRANGYSFLARVATDCPEEAAALADDLDRNLTDFADVSGVSPSTLRLASRVLRGRLDGGPL